MFIFLVVALVIGVWVLVSIETFLIVVGCIFFPIFALMDKLSDAIKGVWVKYRGEKHKKASKTNQGVEKWQ